jgi:hypothetical protein
MEENIKKLEEILGQKYEEWTDETLGKIIASKEAIELFVPELVVHLLLTRKNDRIVNILIPIKYGFDLRAIKQKIEVELKALKEENKPVEEFKKAVIALKDLDNPIFKLAVYLTELAAFGPDHDISKEEDKIKAAIADYKKILLGLRLDQGLQVVFELLDLLYPFTELYFQRYQVDLLKGDQEMEELLKKINEIYSQVSQSQSQDQPESEEGHEHPEEEK